jgi:hypothetical protein
MDKKEAQKLVSLVQDLFIDFEKEHSVIAKVGKTITYSESGELSFKLTIRKEGTASKEERDLERYADMYDLDTNKIGDMSDGKYSLIGFNTSARKNMFIVLKLSTGVRYAIDEYLARKYFGKDHKVKSA